MARQLGRGSVVVAASQWNGPVDFAQLSAAWERAILDLPQIPTAAARSATPPPLTCWDVSQIGGDSGVDDPQTLIDDWVARHGQVLRRIWGPLIGHQWMQLSDDEGVLLVALDHESADQTTCRQMFRDVFAELHGEKPAPRGTYQDFIAWQDRQDRRAAADIWLHHMPPKASSLRWSGGEAATGSQFHRRSISLDSHLAQWLRIEHHEAPQRLLATVLAATTRALAPRAEEASVAVATSRPGRPAGFEQTLGCFVESLPVFADPRRGDTQLIDDLESQLRTIDRCPLPFAGLANALGEHRVPIPRPEVYVAVDAPDSPLAQADAMTVSDFSVPHTEGNFPCGVVLQLDDGRPQLEVLAQAPASRSDVVGELAQSVATALHGLVNDGSVPSQSIVVPHSAAQPDLADSVPIRDVPVRASASSGAASAVLLDQILESWRRGLGRPDLGPDDDFFDAGGDSFAAVQIMTELQADVPMVAIFEYPTARSLAEHVSAVDGTQSDSVLTDLSPGADAALPQIVAIPFGGGDAAIAKPLAEAAAGDCTVRAAQLPGHPGAAIGEELEAHDLVRRIAAEIDVKAAEPLVVYGHCAGTATAVRLAVELQDQGCEPDLVVLAAGTVPDDPAALLQAELETSDAQWAEYLMSLGGLQGVDEQARSAVLAAGRCDHRLAMSAHSELRQSAATLRSPTLCILGDDDPATEDIQSTHRAWRQIAPQAQLAVLPSAGHYFINTHPELIHSLIQHTLTTVN